MLRLLELAFNPYSFLMGFLLLTEEPAILIGGGIGIALITWGLSHLLKKFFGWRNHWINIGLILLVLCALLIGVGLAFADYVCNAGPPDGFCFFAALVFTSPAILLLGISTLSLLIGIIRRNRG